MDAPTALEAAMAVGLDPEMLAHEWQRRAFVCIREMDAKRLAIDPAFVHEYSKERGMDVDVAVLQKAEAQAPSRRQSADNLIWSIRRDWARRELKDKGIPCEKDQDPIERAATVAQELLNLAESHAKTESMTDLKDKIFGDWESSLEGKLPGLPFPIDVVYRVTGGVRDGHVCLLVGHGGTGKSYLTLLWALHLGKLGIPTLMFPLEDNAEIALRRLGCMEAGVNPLRMDTGRASREDIDRAKAGTEAVLKLPIILSDASGTMSDLAVAAQQAKARKGVRAVFVDGFKDVKRVGQGADSESACMNDIKDAAKRLRLPLILSHHVRKPPSGEYSERAWRITQHDILGTGNMWNSARMVLALQAIPEKFRSSHNTNLGKDGWISVDTQQFDYAIEVLKTNHGQAGLRVPVERDAESMVWRRKPWVPGE